MIPCESLLEIISYCTHSGLRLFRLLLSHCTTVVIISYCTHSGLRLYFNTSKPISEIERLYLIARIADCDSVNGPKLEEVAQIISYCTHSGLRPKEASREVLEMLGLYLIARIADCDFITQSCTHINLHQIISYCTHSGLRHSPLANLLRHSPSIISYCTHSGLRPSLSSVLILPTTL